METSPRVQSDVQLLMQLQSEEICKRSYHDNQKSLLEESWEKLVKLRRHINKYKSAIEVATIESIREQSLRLLNDNDQSTVSLLSNTIDSVEASVSSLNTLREKAQYKEAIRKHLIVLEDKLSSVRQQMISKSGELFRLSQCIESQTHLSFDQRLGSLDSFNSITSADYDSNITNDIHYDDELNPCFDAENPAEIVVSGHESVGDSLYGVYRKTMILRQAVVDLYDQIESIEQEHIKTDMIYDRLENEIFDSLNNSKPDDDNGDEDSHCDADNTSVNSGTLHSRNPIGTAKPN